jgi:hypothetical protein
VIARLASDERVGSVDVVALATIVQVSIRATLDELDARHRIAHQRDAGPCLLPCPPGVACALSGCVRAEQL